MRVQAIRTKRRTRTIVQHPAVIANQLKRHLNLVVALLFEGVPDIVNLPSSHLALKLVYELRIDDAEIVRVCPAAFAGLTLRVERRLGAV